MKKLLLMLLFTVLFVPIWAQDIIVTTSSERIDAQVTEVSETEVKYKRQDNPDGPSFIISTSKIASIIYQNGDVQTFQHNTEQPESSQNSANGTLTTVREAEDIVFVPGQKIEKSKKKNEYYYGNIAMDESMYKDFLKLTCAEAYKQYSRGSGMVLLGSIVGAGLLGAGVGCVIPRHPSEGRLIAAGVLMAVGVSFGVTFIVVGGKQESKALNTFNDQCASSLDYKQALSLKFGVSQNGLGLTLNF